VTTTEVARPKRGRQSATDMLRSLAVVAGVVAVTLVFVPGLLHPGKSQRFPASSYTDDVAGFRQLSGRPALSPSGLPSGWTANAASLTGAAGTAHLHIGWATPGAHYAGLEESVAPASRFVPTVLGAGLDDVSGHVDLGGVTWRTLTSARGEYSLFATRHGVTAVVTGSAPDAQLRTLAALLR
jgi:Protein of unknown function (DUF4245)